MTTTSASTYANITPAQWRPDPEDERLHTPSGDSDWPGKDTWFFSMRDDASDQMLNMHITISANRTPPTRVSVTVAKGVRSVTHVQREEGTSKGDWVGNSLAGLDLVHAISGGQEFTLFTQHGYVHKVDVFRNAQFKYVLPPGPEAAGPV